MVEKWTFISPCLSDLCFTASPKIYHKVTHEFDIFLQVNPQRSWWKLWCQRPSFSHSLLQFNEFAPKCVTAVINLSSLGHWGVICVVFWALPLPRWHIYTAPFQSNSLLTFISPLTLNVSLCRSIKMCGLYDIFNRRPLHKLSVISPHDDSRWKQRSVNTLTVGGCLHTVLSWLMKELCCKFMCWSSFPKYL